MKFENWVFFCTWLFVQCSGAALAEEFFSFDGENVYMAELAGAKDVLGSERHKTYMELLRRGECDDAISLLNKAFVAYYPQYAHATENGGRGYRDWLAHVVSDVYPAAALCSKLENLSAQEKITKELYAPIGVYLSGKRRKEPKPEGYKKSWFFRDIIISNIIQLAVDGYHPALPEIAKLYRRGDLIEAGPKAEYYLLKRACHFGVMCAELAPRIGELEKQIPEAVQKDMIARAKRKEFDFKATDLD